MVHVTILDVSPYNHLGNFVAPNKICSRDTKNVSGKHQKQFFYPLDVSQFSYPRRHVTACNLATTAQIQPQSDSRMNHNRQNSPRRSESVEEEREFKGAQLE